MKIPRKVHLSKPSAENGTRRNWVHAPCALLFLHTNIFTLNPRITQSKCEVYKEQSPNIEKPNDGSSTADLCRKASRTGESSDLIPSVPDGFKWCVFYVHVAWFLPQIYPKIGWNILKPPPSSWLCFIVFMLMWYMIHVSLQRHVEISLVLCSSNLLPKLDLGKFRFQSGKWRVWSLQLVDWIDEFEPIESLKV